MDSIYVVTSDTGETRLIDGGEAAERYVACFGGDVEKREPLGSEDVDQLIEEAEDYA